MLLKFYPVKGVQKSRYLLFVLILFLTNCTSYSKYASYNSIPNKSESYSNGNYYRYTNEYYRITMLMYGDFVYAQNMQQYKKMMDDKSITNKILLKVGTNYYMPLQLIIITLLYLNTSLIFP